MVRFEDVKVKHLRKNKELFNQLVEGDADNLDVFDLLDFAATLVLEWDFVNTDGTPIPAGETDNLNVDQLTELFAEFGKLKLNSIPVPNLTA